MDNPTAAESGYDYRKYCILYVDDEEKSLRYFSRAFEGRFRVLTALNAEEGFRVAQERAGEIGVLMTDQQMPGEKGVRLLERIRQEHPQIIRILVTAYSDIDAAIEAVNSGAIYRYISKPWDVTQLEISLRRALEFFMVQRERDFLLEEKLSVLRARMVSDRVISMGILAAGLGHHLRNSLVAVRTFLELAPDKLRAERLDWESLNEPNFWKNFHEHVITQIQRITDLLNHLGLAAEQSSASFDETVDLVSTIREAQEGLASRFQEKGIRFEDRLPDDLPRVSADSAKIRRLFQLLLEEELGHLPDGCVLSATAKKVLLKESAPGVELVLSDNGPGIPIEAIGSAFDPFYVRTDNPQEFGLRLITCFFIVYHHGGNVEVKSPPGEGASFVMRLPVDPRAMTSRPEADSFLAKALHNEEEWRRMIRRS